MKKIIICFGVLFAAFIVSCDKEDLDKINPNGVTFDTYFNNGDELTAGVNAIYAMIQSNSMVAREWFFTHDLRGDEMSSGGGQLETPRNQLLIGVHDPGNFLVNSIWNGWYRAIHRANVVIGKAPEVENINDDLRNRLLGEARFLRGWAYYEIATFWGDAPLYTEFVQSVNGAKPKSPQSELYATAIADLQFAQTVLPADYDDANKGRATRGAAQMLLARVYVQQGDYSSAKTELDKIVNSGEYNLVDNYLDLTNEEGEFNSESIFEIVYAPSGGAFNWGADSDGQNVAEEAVRTQEYSAIGWRNLIPSNKLLNSYERESNGAPKTDPRYDYSFYLIGETFNNGQSVLTDDRVQGNTSIVDGVEQKVSWQKYSIMYKLDAGFATAPINMRIMRYADVLLLLAECENELGNQARALELVNQVRARPSVDMPPLPTATIPTGTQDQLRKAIQHERMVELAGEQIRNFDIVRWRKHGKLDGEPISYFIPNKHELLPIPQSEIDNNPNLTQADQNPGY
jgi:tetratricopeptide (TPR) repeat protein